MELSIAVLLTSVVVATAVLLVVIPFLSMFPNATSVRLIRAGNADPKAKSQSGVEAFSVKRDLVLPGNGDVKYNLQSGKFELFIANGKSMVKKGIQMGAVVVVDNTSKVAQIAPGAVVALCVKEPIVNEQSVGILKLRLFNRIGEDPKFPGKKRLFLDRYNEITGEVEPCDTSHTVRAYIGEVVHHYTVHESSKLKEKYGIPKLKSFFSAERSKAA